jgi:hypothetical protein
METNPWKVVGITLLVVFVIGFVFAIIRLAMLPGRIAARAAQTTNRMVDNAFDTAYQEFKPEELLRKYEWFKNASASLDKKLADITIAETRMKKMELDYKGLPRKDWPREDREQYNLWSSETAGIRMSYNSLAAEYNAQMSKFNWRFTNAGDLPQGATEVLKREYRTYESN